MIQDSSFSSASISIDTADYIVTDNILFRQVEDEGILLHISTGTYYSLSETSILFWQALSAKQPLDQVVDAIVDQYEVEKEVVIADLQSLLKDLLASNLISSVAS